MGHLFPPPHPHTHTFLCIFPSLCLYLYLVQSVKQGFDMVQPSLSSLPVISVCDRLDLLFDHPSQANCHCALTKPPQEIKKPLCEDRAGIWNDMHGGMAYILVSAFVCQPTTFFFFFSKYVGISLCCGVGNGSKRSKRGSTGKRTQGQNNDMHQKKICSDNNNNINYQTMSPVGIVFLIIWNTVITKGRNCMVWHERFKALKWLKKWQCYEIRFRGCQCLQKRLLLRSLISMLPRGQVKLITGHWPGGYKQCLIYSLCLFAISQYVMTKSNDKVVFRSRFSDPFREQSLDK